MSVTGMVSVVVVGSNGRARLERCLNALAATGEAVLEIIVADGRLTAADVAWLASTYPQLRVAGPRCPLDPAAAARRAIAVAGGSHLALLASHAVVEPGWLRALVETLAGDASIAAACPTLTWNDEPGAVCARGGMLTWLGIAFESGQSSPVGGWDSPASAEETSFPTAAALLISRRDWEESGGFDPAFRGGNEDADLGWRLWLLGRRVVVCRDSVVRCDGSLAAGGARRHGWEDTVLLRQTIRMLAKHYPPRFLLHALRWTIVARLRVNAWRSLAVALAWNVVHLPGTLARRRWIQRRRLAAHEDLFGRGVLLEFADPPRPPLRLAGAAATDPGEWIPSHVLLPGEDSALGRLRSGWHPPRREAGEVVRWTAGAARCALRVAPDAAGLLQVHLLLPEGEGTTAEVTLTGNGATVKRACGGEGWSRVEVPVRSGPDGMLAVELRAAAPPAAPGSRGRRARQPGCAVREIRFLPDRPPTPNGPGSISVIIPTFNRWAILTETLAALGRQTMREFEVIVVDDGSTDTTWESLVAWQRAHPELPLKAVRQPNLKPGRARNRGLEDASGDLVLFLGDDIVPQPDLLEQHLAKHRQVGETIGVLGLTEWDRARMRVTPFLEFVNTDGPQFAYAHFRDGGGIPFTGFYTSNISLPRWVLGTAPFHPAFTFVDWEDIELGYRLSLRGLRLLYHAGARAVHYHPTGIGQFYRRQEHVGRTIGVILALHPELAGNPAMPPLEPAPWYGWARRVAPHLVPLLERWDRRGGRCPLWLYRNLLLCAFWTGRGAAAATHSAVNT